MKLETLLQGLSHTQPAVRLNAACLIGLVDETRALDALAAWVQVEAEPQVKQMMNWSGKHLHQLKQDGYSTVDQIFRHFLIQRELENPQNPHEARLLAEMQRNFEMNLAVQQSRATWRNASIGFAVGGLPGALIGMAMAGRGSATPASTDIEITERLPAPKPGTADVTLLLKRLREDLAPAEREKAALELVQVNNPAALPHLAAIFLREANPEVKTTIQRVCKTLYISAVYWQMTQDGSLDAEIARRKEAMGLNNTPEERPAPPDKPASKEDIAEIMRRAEEAKKKRKK